MPDQRQLLQRLEALEKLVHEQLDEKNHWNALVRGWISKTVEVQAVNSLLFTGKLRWVDRYTMCLDVGDEPTIVHKGAIIAIRQHKSL